ncbi:MAG: SH3 domain-containing protein [Candidatus Ventricola sp.]
MIKAEDAIRTARSLLGTPYSELDCINLIKKVIRTSPGGVPNYTTAGTNTLWDSANVSAKYRDLTWRQETSSALRAPSPEGKADPVGARAGMLAFKRNGTDVHHVGLVTGEGTVIHSSSAKGCVVETALDESWQLLAVHRYIETLPQSALPTAPSGGSLGDGTEDKQMEAYQMKVAASSLNVRDEPGIGGARIGRLGEGAVVTVLEEFDNGWRRIVYGDSGSGYVDGSYLGAYTETAGTEATKITIIDSADNHFCPVGDWRVLIGSID